MSVFEEKVHVCCSVCGEKWYPHRETVEEFKACHSECGVFASFSEAMVKRLKWSKYDWAEYFSNHLENLTD